MRVPTHWCSVALLAATAGPLLAQGLPDDGPLAALSLAPTFPDRPSPHVPPSTRPTTTTVVAPWDTRPLFLDQSDAAPQPPASLSPQSWFLSPLLPPYRTPVFSADTHVVAETSLTWQSARLPGQLKVGAWSESPDADLPTFPGGSRPHAWGPYLVLDQMVWRTNPATDETSRGLGLFLVYDHANTDLFPTTEHLSAGLSFKGLLPDHPHDLFGVGLSWAHLTSDPAANFTQDSETAVELFYQFRITPHLSLRPDVQYVLDPASKDSDNAVVASVRLELEY